MPRMKNRQRFPPGGWKFYVPESKWMAPDSASFDSVVNALVMHIAGQPQLQAKGWPTDYDSLAEKVDGFNAEICKRMGWADWFIEGGGQSFPLPFQQPPAPPPPPMDQNKLAAAAASLKKVWLGIKTLKEWSDSGAPAVAPELSAKRAAVCATCPKNTPGDWTSWFTRPAAEGIKKMVEALTARKLSTPDDDQLNVCEVCLCPMRVKVHPPIEIINSWMGDKERAELSAVANPSGGCWVVKEIWPT